MTNKGYGDSILLSLSSSLLPGFSKNMVIQNTHTHKKTPQNKKKIPDAFGRLLKGDEKEKFWGC